MGSAATGALPTRAAGSSSRPSSTGFSARGHGRPLEGSAILLEGPLAWALAELSTVDDLVVVGTPAKTGFLYGRVLGSRSVQVALAVVPTRVAVIPEVDLRFQRGVVTGIEPRPARARRDRGDRRIRIFRSRRRADPTSVGPRSRDAW